MKQLTITRLNNFFIALTAIGFLAQHDVLFAYTYKQQGSTGKYAQEYDAMIDTLLLAKEHGAKEVVVRELPDPGMLIPLHINEQRWTLKQILDLPYEIKVEN